MKNQDILKLNNYRSRENKYANQINSSAQMDDIDMELKRHPSMHYD